MDPVIRMPSSDFLKVYWVQLNHRSSGHTLALVLKWEEQFIPNVAMRWLHCTNEQNKKNPRGINYAPVNFYAETIWENQEPEKN